MGALNLRHAFRALVKAPFVSIVGVLSLALGIGANAAAFSVFYQAILRPLPVPANDELVNLASPGPKPGSQAVSRIGLSDSLFSYPMFRDLARAGTSFGGIAAHRGFGANISYRGHTLSGYGQLVSGSYFDVLRLQPVLGRLIGDADAAAVGESPVVVLTHEHWRVRFAETNVLHETLLVNGQPMTIVGVAPRGFNGITVGAKPQIFVPITIRGRLEQFDAFENRRSYWVYLFARLAPGVSRAQAETAINVPYRAILNEVEAPLQSEMSAQTLARFRAKQILLEDGSLGQSAVRDVVRPSGVLLLCVTATVLLIACVNIANLLLARSASRASEMAIRLSVGGSRRQLVLQLLGESYVLAILGALGGIVVSRWTLALIKQLVPPEAQTLIEMEVNRDMLIATAALALPTGVLFGLVPALQSTRPDLITSLRAQAGQTAGNRVASRFRAALATTQIALSMALLVSAGLLAKSLLNVTRVDLGLQIDNVATFRLSPGMNGYTPERARALFQDVEDALVAVPGVTSITASRIPLLAGASSGRDVRVQGFEAGPDTDRSSRYNVIGTDYFRTLGIPILAGREFTRADALGAPKVAIVNEVFTKKFQIDRGAALGLRMSSDGGDILDTEIVGVVGNTKYAGVKSETPPQFYLPYRQDDLIGTIAFYTRTSLDPATLVGMIPELVGRIDPNLPVQDLKTMPEQVSDNVFIDRGISVLSALFAGLATLLAAIGLYGVLAYTVAQRTREIGVRMALGADASRVRRMILGQVGLMTIVGGIIGFAGATALLRSMRSVLFELEGADLTVLITAAILLGLVALCAGLVPALRASRIDPMKALRYE